MLQCQEEDCFPSCLYNVAHQNFYKVQESCQHLDSFHSWSGTIYGWYHDCLEDSAYYVLPLCTRADFVRGAHEITSMFYGICYQEDIS